jgi:hypothetical protein
LYLYNDRESEELARRRVQLRGCERSSRITAGLAYPERLLRLRSDEHTQFAWEFHCLQTSARVVLIFCRVRAVHIWTRCLYVLAIGMRGVTALEWGPGYLMPPFFLSYSIAVLYVHSLHSNDYTL